MTTLTNENNIQCMIREALEGTLHASSWCVPYAEVHGIGEATDAVYNIFISSREFAQASMSLPFSDRLACLVALEASAAAGSTNRAERMGDMIEALARALGFTIAIATNGNPQGIETMVTAAEKYALDEAAEKAPLAQLMTLTRRT